MEQLMCLGRFVFSVATAPFDTLDRTDNWRWASNNRFQNEPAAQFVGRGENTMTLNGKLYPEFTGGNSNMEILREMADKGEPHILVRGNGEVLGYWVITSLQTREGNFFADGVPQSTDFTLSLRYYSNNYGNVSQGTPIAPLITRLF